MTRKSNQSRVSGPFKLLIAYGVALLALVSVQPAAAAVASISGAQTSNSYVEWNTMRTNHHERGNRVSYNVGGTNVQGFSLGLRNNSGAQFARGEGSGRTVTVRTNSGSASIPRANFRLNTRMNTACGGSGCGTINWSGTLTYDIPF